MNLKINKIAIHHRQGSFSDRWILYCNEKKIPYKIVNCFDSDIIEQLKDCDVLMWNFHQSIFEDTLMAKQLTNTLEQAGKKVFPDFNTAWHFDDKVGQKYMLEAIGAPLVPSYVFYTKKEALAWIEKSSFPKVFKLRGGAGAANVKLVKTKQKAKKLVHKAFGKGFPQFDRWGYLQERIRKIKEGQDSYLGFLKGIGRLFIPTTFSKKKGNEKGYVFFQKYIPDNDYDIRVIIIDKKAFAIKRLVRKNDFRASGSGKILYGKENFDANTLKIAFETAKKLKSQCSAFDFVYDKNNNPLIVEISYAFSMKGYDPCVGYWDEDLNFHEGAFNPYGWMVDTILKDN